MSWQRVTGHLVYEPVRPGFRKTHKVRTLVLELPRDDLDLYYQALLRDKYGNKYMLQRPLYGLHVTVVRGDEKPPFAEAWLKYAGEILTVRYNPEMLSKKWQFWSMPVRSQALKDIREELGLTPEHDFHVTVAREYDWQFNMIHRRT